MRTKLKKSYRFALRGAILITVLMLITYSIVVFLKLSPITTAILLIVSTFFVTFFIIQFRAEKFIYTRVKKIYDDVSLLESTSFQQQPITTDMKTLTEEIEKFARIKKLEIETLKIRENYRREFIGNVSHELKTPLFTIQGYITTLLDGNIKDKTIFKKYLSRADKGVERLIYIVKDLDMITQLETGNLSLEYSNFNIIEVVESAFELMEMKAAKKNITLILDRTYKTPIMVYADKERIQQVITNLIVNSIKYGKQEGTTEVSIENLVKNKIIIRITDNGEGIKEENISRLFERFYRVDKSRNRKVGGSGLGLSIVKHIIEAHKERIYVESQFGIGSEFSFTLEKSKKDPLPTTNN